MLPLCNAVVSAPYRVFRREADIGIDNTSELWQNYEMYSRKKTEVEVLPSVLLIWQSPKSRFFFVGTAILMMHDIKSPPTPLVMVTSDDLMTCLLALRPSCSHHWRHCDGQLFQWSWITDLVVRHACTLAQSVRIATCDVF